MNQEYIETLLQTKKGNFIIRVYKDEFNKETTVLYTTGLDINKPVLLRIHSECLTGDIFHSSRCDCGEQLNKSLEQIQQSKNGMLIYLRQEGRGIGLFEKMKTYKLQDQGYDTYEANVALGHKPDARTYEWVDKIIKDFKIKEIDLITNNPDKIRNIESFGIKVRGRVDLSIKPNEYNIKYFDTKRLKFSHLL